MSKEKHFSLETFNNCVSVMLTHIDMLGLFSGLFRRALAPTWVLCDQSDEFCFFLSFSIKKETIYIKLLTELIHSFLLFLYFRCFTSKLKTVPFSF